MSRERLIVAQTLYFRNFRFYPKALERQLLDVYMQCYICSEEGYGVHNMLRLGVA